MVLDSALLWQRYGRPAFRYSCAACLGVLPVNSRLADNRATFYLVLTGCFTEKSRLCWIVHV